MRRSRARRPTVRAVIAALVAALLTGCSSFQGLYDVPLPGGAEIGDHPYRVTAHFDDVLDLVPQSEVRVDDIPVGRVEAVELSDDGMIAEVSLLVDGDVRLPADAVAELRQTSLLGEKFVELAPPPGEAAEGLLQDGAVVPVERTGRNFQVEEVLGATSMLLNGGGIGQLKQITSELNGVFDGNSEELRELLGNLEEFVSGLDEHREEIVRAIDATEQLSGTLNERTDQIGEILDELGPGIEVLSEQSDEITEMFVAMDSLSEVATDTVRRSKDDLLDSLRALEPVLSELAEAGHDLPRAMELLLTYPFTDASLDAVRGDYMNGFLELDANTAGSGGSASPAGLPLPSVDAPTAPAGGGS
ncbi:phospholipid/cholesterol/gamma-HCH transport system substrate-binding protein [Haloechinothrix alba]|uniref:Phospholipid/cholesterol/gamma-HCH transport system substrate-binding protein n=1 Tax=Haloechinothrix alba TaxID=664784 RepID=A0A238VG27_9PSEU|nr:MCE family protein [Haloechinothrix alba]SNR33118.1 phospholipid/cholesterol/gamma-HCH transport system substrate-binding protein [Haloechinothrix alba]